MPLDRIITVHLQDLGKRVEGRYSDGWITTYRIWAERVSSGATDEGSEAGTITQAVVTWRVRWLEAFERHRIDLMSIEDGSGFAWNVESVNESGGRRRFLELGAIRGDQIVV